MAVKILKSKNGRIFEPTKRVGLFCLAVEEMPSEEGTSRNIKLASDQSRRVAFIFRTMEQFDAVFKNMGIMPVEGTVLGGIVAVKEQMEPFNASDLMKGIKYLNPTAKAAGLVCAVAGKPIYRDSFYTTDESTDDILIPHENQIEINLVTPVPQEYSDRNVVPERTSPRVKILENWDRNGIYTETKNYSTNGKLLSIAVEEIMTESRYTSGCCLGGYGREKDRVISQGRRVAYVYRTKETFDAIFRAEGITPIPGAEFSGCVVITERLAPLKASRLGFGVKFMNQDCKRADIPFKIKGQPIYRDYVYTPVYREDVLLEHDNQEEIDDVLSKRTTRLNHSSYNSTSYVEEKESYFYPDGYGGYVDDDLIDDALGGEPEAYWNLD